VKAWWSRFGFWRRSGASHAAPQASATPGTVSASGEGAVAVAGSAGVVVAGHHNTVAVYQSEPAERVSLDDLAAASRARMVQRWHASGVPLTLTEEFADTPQVGVLPNAVTAVPECGVVVLEGDFGAGKSLAAERQHQRDITAARADPQEPIPVHLTAQHIQGHVIDAATRAARRLGDPSLRGVALVVDGLDEPGPIRGKELLDQALGWATSAAGGCWRILTTARPGLEMDAELRRVMPELPEDEAAALMDRLGGRGLAVRSQSSMVRSVLRRPLFAIIGAQLQQDDEQLPSRPVAFLGALVTRALRDVESVKEQRTERLLQQLAALCTSAGGWAAAADVGSPGEVQALLDTRLVVRRGDRHLGFALPVLEQYFAGQALLANGVLANVVQNVELLERWRYGLAMASPQVVGSRSAGCLSRCCVTTRASRPGPRTRPSRRPRPSGKTHDPICPQPWSVSVCSRPWTPGSGRSARQPTVSSCTRDGPARSRSMPISRATSWGCTSCAVTATRLRDSRSRLPYGGRNHLECAPWQRRSGRSPWTTFQPGKPGVHESRVDLHCGGEDLLGAQPELFRAVAIPHPMHVGALFLVGDGVRVVQQAVRVGPPAAAEFFLEPYHLRLPGAEPSTEGGPDRRAARPPVEVLTQRLVHVLRAQWGVPAGGESHQVRARRPQALFGVGIAVGQVEVPAGAQGLQARGEQAQRHRPGPGRPGPQHARTDPGPA
jgi:hypothetical protein